MRWPSVSFPVGTMHSVDKGANFVRILFPWASFDAGRDVDAPGMKQSHGDIYIRSFESSCDNSAADCIEGWSDRARGDPVKTLSRPPGLRVCMGIQEKSKQGISQLA